MSIGADRAASVAAMFFVTLSPQRVGPYNSPHWLREGEDHGEEVMVGVGHGAVNFWMEGVDWSSCEDPVDDSFCAGKENAMAWLASGYFEMRRKAGHR